MFRTTRSNSLLALSASAFIASISASAQADTTHDTHIACYASVDVQCKKASCSKDDKNWGYNQCDQYYSSSSNSSSAKPKRPRPTGLEAANNNQRFRAALRASFKRQ